MSAFHTFAVPHRDILEERLTMDVFAADLWEVFKQRAPAEYKDSETFFTKTYMTEGLKHLLSIVEKRLQGKGGDPVIQIQTPFGGGKTHALIAMLHKATAWKARSVVLVGTALSADMMLWGEIEKQLTGKNLKFTAQAAPGREAIRELLAAHQPVLILMDEVLQYATKAATVKVGSSNLASQTMAFMQELTEAAGTLPDVCMVVTLPSSLLEHYDEGAERLFQQLQRVSGRVEKIYTPVQEHEISKVVRRRLFQSIDLKKAEGEINDFMEYASKETILPADQEPSEYRRQFVDSYPFLPDVIQVLYHRWGSFPTFQRTRGVLRLLSLVIYALRKSQQPYLTLSDFDLANMEIRRELLKHSGPEFDAVIAADITSDKSGASIIDRALGTAYRGLKLGARAATAIFMYSHSGGQLKGATIAEIKRNATTLHNPASAIAEAVEQFKDRLFYFQYQDSKYLFTNQPNLNRMLLTKMENVSEEKIKTTELEYIKKRIAGQQFKIYVWPNSEKEISDTPELKLVILPNVHPEVMLRMVQHKGEYPRVYRNTLVFLTAADSERSGFFYTVKRKIAFEEIAADATLNLTETQRKEVKKGLETEVKNLHEAIRRLYQDLHLPFKDGIKTISLGIPTYGESKKLDDECYERLRTDSEILTTIAPIALKTKFLSDKDYVETKQIYQASLTTPGEMRFTSRTALLNGVSQGVQLGLFGLGELVEGNPVYRYFKESPASFALEENEILISEVICRQQKEAKDREREKAGATIYPLTGAEVDGKRPAIVSEKGKEVERLPSPQHSQLELKFKVPKGKVAGIMGVMNLLQSRFDTLELQIIARDGTISKEDYEQKIEEAFGQLGIELED